MDQSELQILLDKLIAAGENEVVEFKAAGNNYDTDKIGQYFSALSNEANLLGVDRAWLVFGVSDKTRTLVGTRYRPEAEHLHSLKNQIAQGTEPSITLRNIHTLQVADVRVLLFEIPPAPRGLPIAWMGHYYGRAGESLTSLDLTKQDEIRQQTLQQDWSAQVVAQATVADLDGAALQTARDRFAQKHANRFSLDEVLQWTLAQFLERARLTRDGQITRTALLLLGKPESVWQLSPQPAQLSWKLDAVERAYEHFAPPFLLNTSQLYQRIRNIQLRLLPQDQLLPFEVSKYDQKMVLEALHNCIAHQDYTRNGRVVVTERHDRLVFENEGGFFDGQPDDYIQGSKTPRRYRNPFLAQAMAELNMIDTMGYGIHDMHTRQAKRYLPMPDYDLDEAGAVRLTLYGGVVDPAYSRMLMQQRKLPLEDILALDRVQKKLSIPDQAVARLKRARLIEGRKPNLHVSAAIAAVTGGKADYIRTRTQDDEFYAKLLTDYLAKFGEASRSDINKLLLDKLGDARSADQKSRKISALLTKLRLRGIVENTGSDRTSSWRLAEK